MNAVIISFDPKEKYFAKTRKRMRAVKSARKAKDKLHKACEKVSETHERTLHRQEQNNTHGKQRAR